MIQDYKPAGSQRGAFQVACASPTLDLTQPVVHSYGLSSDRRRFGTHYLEAVASPDLLPQCHVRINTTALMFNRDWHRNVWHRVANDAYPAWVALRKFGLVDQRVHVVHLDWAEASFQGLYAMLSDRVEWLRDWPPAQRYVCFDDVLFMVSQHWRSTFPETHERAHQLALHPWVAEFAQWVPRRVGVHQVLSPLARGLSTEVAVTWISRNVSYPGFRAVLNEDQVVDDLALALV